MSDQRDAGQRLFGALRQVRQQTILLINPGVE